MKPTKPRVYHSTSRPSLKSEKKHYKHKNKNHIKSQAHERKHKTSKIEMTKARLRSNAARSESAVHNVILHHISHEVSKIHNVHSRHPHHGTNATLDGFDHLDTLLNLSLIHKQHAVQVAKYLFHIGKMTAKTGLNIVTAHQQKLPKMKSRKEEAKTNHAIGVGRRVVGIGKEILLRALNLLNAAVKDQSPTTAVPETYKQKRLPKNFNLVVPVVKMVSLCSHSPIHKGLTLRGGFHSGKFYAQGKVENMQACIKLCCARKNCDLAFMVKRLCYSVSCYKHEMCKSVTAYHVTKYHPQVAYVFRGQKKTPNQNESSRSQHQSLPTRPIKHKYKKKKSNVNDYVDHIKKIILKLTDDTTSGKGNIKTPNNEASSRQTLRTSNEQAQSQDLHEDFHSKKEFHNGNKQCPHSKVINNASIYKGLRAGDYTYYGDNKTMNKCMEKCCSSSNCDIAFMLDDSCYGIECTAENLCRTAPIRQSKYKTSVVFITRRFNKPLWDPQSSSDAKAPSQSEDHPQNSTRLNSFENREKQTLQEKMDIESTVDLISDALNINDSATTSDQLSKVDKLLEQKIVHLVNDHVLDDTTHQQIQQEDEQDQKDIGGPIVHRVDTNFETHEYNKGHGHASDDHMIHHKYLLGRKRIHHKESEHLAFYSQDIPSISEEEKQGKDVVSQNIPKLKKSNLLSKFDAMPSLAETADHVASGESELDTYDNEAPMLSSSATTEDDGSSDIEDIKVSFLSNNQSGLPPNNSMSWPVSSVSANAMDSYEPNSALEPNDVQDIVVSLIPVQKDSKTISPEFAQGKTESSLQRTSVSSKTMNMLYAPTSSIVFKYPTNRSSRPSVRRDAAEPTLSETATSETEIIHSGKAETVSRIEMFEDMSGSGTYYKEIEEPGEKELAIPRPNPGKVAVKITLPLQDLMIDRVKETSGELPVSYTENSGPEMNKDEYSGSGSDAEGEIGNTHELSPSQCYASYVFKNATLKGGYSSGNFSFVGKFNSSDDCLTECCNSKHCDLAFMVLGRCFAVSCRKDTLCVPVRAHNSEHYKPSLMYLPRFTRMHSIQLFPDDNNKTIKAGVKPKDTEVSGSGDEYSETGSGNITPNAESTENSNEDSSITYFTKFPKASVKNINGRVPRPLPDLMDDTSSKDSLIHNDSSDHHPHNHQTKIKPSSVSGAGDQLSASLNARISSEANHSIEKFTFKDTSGLTGLNCEFDKVVYNVTLRGGRQSGTFQLLKETKNLTVCTQKCCDHNDCDVALLLENYCFMVTCKNRWLCEPIPTKIARYQPVAAYRRAKQGNLKPTHCKFNK